MHLLDCIDPLHYISQSDYTEFWTGLFSTILRGFWGRSLAVILIVLAFYLGIRRQRFQLGIWFIFLAAGVIYGATLLKWLGLL
ncbi:MAG: hypothetical protein PHG91_09825 [Syntrophales bacterium]|nr:hypothetical protein [Syntrophales bacterium]MDD5532859.1 hypothetical protein [Syntrophales bacterium]